MTTSEHLMQLIQAVTLEQLQRRQMDVALVITADCATALTDALRALEQEPKLRSQIEQQEHLMSLGNDAHLRDEAELSRLRAEREHILAQVRWAFGVDPAGMNELHRRLSVYRRKP